MNSKILVKILAVLITLVLVVLLLNQINLGDIFTTLQNINLIYIIGGFLLYTCSYFFRAWRFHVLLNREVSTKDLFYIECVHNSVNNLLPARTGELSYVYLLKKINNKTTGDGVATLVVARIFDFIALISLFFIAVILVTNIPKIMLSALWIIAVFALFLLIVLVILITRGKNFVINVQKTAERLHCENNPVVNYLIRKGFETVESLDKIQVKKSIAGLMTSSLLIWGVNYLVVYLLMKGMNIQISILLVILGGTFILLTTVLPIQGIAGFGTTETIWTLVFVPLGLSMDQAIISGFCYHIVIILYFTILGLYGWITVRLKISL
ncbi:MAG: flippase-like domain-containing protein [Methanoregula sp.]|nr:flippase-like domain-containing protein [Methanoregula sp.]